MGAHNGVELMPIKLMETLPGQIDKRYERMCLDGRIQIGTHYLTGEPLAELRALCRKGKRLTKLPLKTV